MPLRRALKRSDMRIKCDNNKRIHGVMVREPALPCSTTTTTNIKRQPSVLYFQYKGTLSE